ncbi:hypothetical protein FPOAC2_12472 [Fusarium poae]
MTIMTVMEAQGACEPDCRHCQPTASLPLPRHLFSRSLSERVSVMLIHLIKKNDSLLFYFFLSFHSIKFISLPSNQLFENMTLFSPSKTPSSCFTNLVCLPSWEPFPLNQIHGTIHITSLL